MYESILATFKSSIVLEAAQTVVIIGSSLKPNHHREIYLAQIRETLRNKARWLFLIFFGLFLNRVLFWEETRAVAKIGPSLKPK